MLQDFANLVGLEIQWIDTFRPEEALQKPVSYTHLTLPTILLV